MVVVEAVCATCCLGCPTNEFVPELDLVEDLRIVLQLVVVVVEVEEVEVVVLVDLLLLVCQSCLR